MAGAIRSLVLGKGREEAGGRPSFLVRLCGELWPDRFDAGQAQLIQQQLDAAASIRSLCWSCRFSLIRLGRHDADGGQLIVDVERCQLDGDTRDRGRLGPEAVAQRGKIG